MTVTTFFTHPLYTFLVFIHVSERITSCPIEQTSFWTQTTRVTYISSRTGINSSNATKNCRLNPYVGHQTGDLGAAAHWPTARGASLSYATPTPIGTTRHKATPLTIPRSPAARRRGDAVSLTQTPTFRVICFAKWCVAPEAHSEIFHLRNTSS